jgi:outer membrane lipoprotein SlyB
MALRSPVLAAALGTAAILYGCSTYSNVSTTQIISKVAGDSQTAVAGTVLPIRPAVQVTDSIGATVAGVTVQFAVTRGGGSILGATAITGANGIATSGDWKLGGTPGPNDVTASVSNANVHFTAVGIADTLPGASSQKP